MEDETQPFEDQRKERLEQAKEILNYFIVSKGNMPPEEYAAALSTIRNVLIEARPNIRKDDETEFIRVFQMVSDDPMRKLTSQAQIDDFMDTVNHIIDNADFNKMTEDLYSAALEEEDGV